MRVRFTQLPGVDWGQSRAFPPTHRRNALHSVCKQQAFFKYRELGNVIPRNVYRTFRVRWGNKFRQHSFARANFDILLLHVPHEVTLVTHLFWIWHFSSRIKKKVPEKNWNTSRKNTHEFHAAYFQARLFFSFPEIARPYATAQHQVWLLRKLENQFFERLVCTFRASHEYQNRD